MPKQWELLLRHLVFMSCLLFGNATSWWLCPLDSNSDYVTAICFGPLQYHSPFINWTLSTRGQGDTQEVVITCDTVRGRCFQSQSEGLEASVTTSGQAFISIATFRKFDSGHGPAYVTCSTWGGKNSAPGVILCQTAMLSVMDIGRCEDVIHVEPHYEMLCEKTTAYCGIYELTGKRARSSNLTNDAEPVTLKSVCKKMTAELALERFKRDALYLDFGKPAKCAEINVCTPRNSRANKCTPVCGCEELTGGDMKIKCQEKKTFAILNVTCYCDGNNVTNSFFQFDHKTNNYDKLFCLCSAEPTPECNGSNSYTIVGFAFKNKNLSCESLEVESSNSFSRYYIFAGVLSVYCFIFVSATCAFIAKHGAGLYAYYYMDQYRKVKMELTNQQNKPPLPPPRLPPRRPTACSVNTHWSETGVIFDESTGSSDHHEVEVSLFKTHAIFWNSFPEQAALLPLTPQGTNGETLDDGYLVPKSLSLPCNTGNAVASNLEKSTPKRFHSFKETCPRITRNGFPPPLPCRRQDGNLVVSEFKCTISDSSNSISSQSTSLDSDDSLSIRSVDDYT